MHVLLHVETVEVDDKLVGVRLKIDKPARSFKNAVLKPYWHISLAVLTFASEVEENYNANKETLAGPRSIIASPVFTTDEMVAASLVNCDMSLLPVTQPQRHLLGRCTGSKTPYSLPLPLLTFALLFGALEPLFIPFHFRNSKSTVDSHDRHF